MSLDFFLTGAPSPVEGLPGVGFASPWLGVGLVDTAPGQVHLNLVAQNLAADEFVSGLYLNFDPARDPAQLTFNVSPNSTGLSAATITTGINAFTAGNCGTYDIRLGFGGSSDSDQFAAGKSASIDLTAAGSLNIYSLLAGSPTGDWPGLFAAAEVCNTTTGTSKWVATSTYDVAVIPEPSTYALLLGLALFTGTTLHRLLRRTHR